MTESQPDYKKGVGGRTKGLNFLLHFNGRITLLRNKHKDHGPKALPRAGCGGQSNGEEGHSSDGGCLGLWEGQCTFKISTAAGQSKGRVVRTVFTPDSCMNSHQPRETPSIVPSYVLGSQFRSESYTSNWMITQRKLNRVRLGLFRHGSAIFLRLLCKEWNSLE